MIKRQNKGITLIALVVTIIVLLILAGVSITLLTGENGVITQATRAKEEQTIKGVEERMNLAAGAVRTKILAEKAKNGAYDARKDENITILKDIVKSD